MKKKDNESGMLDFVSVAAARRIKEKEKEKAVCKNNTASHASENSTPLAGKSITISLRPDTVEKLDTLCDMYGIPRSTMIDTLASNRLRAYPSTFILLFRKLTALAQALKFARMSDKTFSAGQVKNALSRCFELLEKAEAGKAEISRDALKEASR